MTGFSFTGDTLLAQAEALLHSLSEALNVNHANPKQWQAIKNSAKNSRFGWDDVVTDYITYLY